MKLNHFSLIVLALALLTTSCKKTVIEQVCKKRYLTSVKVLKVEDSESLDPLNGPDLRIDMATTASFSWSYSSNLSEDVNVYPITIAFPTRVLVSDESWSFQLIDEDLLVDELVCTGTFNPYENGTDGIITVSKNGVDVLEFNYEEEE